jgi:tryptophan-specific transport protein
VSESVNHKPLPLSTGVAIVAGTAVGAGMFSIPMVSVGMWFSWSLLLMLVSWLCMLHSAMMILEANLNFAPGASFSTFVRDILGERWNAFNSLTLLFVLYILTYAYISGGGSMLSQTLENSTGYQLPTQLASLLFAGVLAGVVWFSTNLVGRVTAVLLGGMVITFLLSIAGLTITVRLPVLLDSEWAYAPYLLAAVPYFLTSFGFHGCVPSLMKYYGRDPQRILKCLVIGSSLSFFIYMTWQIVSLGNISREEFRPILAAGGNMGDLVGALRAVASSDRLADILSAFASMAVVSSFLGVTLGLFDFMADKFQFDDSGRGRTKTALITFLPPTFCAILFPHGFLYAIGLAGLSAAVWGTIVPALCARASRVQYGNPLFRVWGGNTMIYIIIFYGCTLVVCWLLAAFGLLPVFQ